MYMSYCRFEGTRRELEACLSAVEEHINEEAEYEVSEEEIKQFRRMVNRITDFLQENELLNEWGEINEEALDDICAKMAIGYNEE